MNHPESLLLRWVYCLTILAAVLPIGLASSGWVGLTVGISPLQAVPIIGPLVFIALGIYRVVLVTRVPGTLDSYVVSGAATRLRKIGMFCLYVGAVVGILNWLSGPVMK